ncbi:hypothetical protein J2857_001269 [Neorhizobium galegae]|uniref:hypothetical protein n=1 Tax=Neorhizobium galegae TaxID=399 RepID=UPI001AE5CD84|nr:hypothetical protein [Neorhizobium galegae]MBP2558518.1 hypothetical protein [Neorhizobium galegae]
MDEDKKNPLRFADHVSTFAAGMLSHRIRLAQALKYREAACQKFRRHTAQKITTRGSVFGPNRLTDQHHYAGYIQVPNLHLIMAVFPDIFPAL